MARYNSRRASWPSGLRVQAPGMRFGLRFRPQGRALLVEVNAQGVVPRLLRLAQRPAAHLLPHRARAARQISMRQGNAAGRALGPTPQRRGMRGFARRGNAPGRVPSPSWCAARRRRAAATGGGAAAGMAAGASAAGASAGNSTNPGVASPTSPARRDSSARGAGARGAGARGGGGRGGAFGMSTCKLTQSPLSFGSPSSAAGSVAGSGGGGEMARGSRGASTGGGGDASGVHAPRTLAAVMESDE